MARFTVHTDERKKKKRRLLAWFYIIAGVVCFLFYFFFNGQTGLPGWFIPILIGVNGTWIGSDEFMSMGKLRFVEINEQYVEWLIYDKNYPQVFIEWEDIQWIKKEKDGSVTIFQASSFNNNLSFTELTVEDKNEILHLLVQYAMSRQIRLVNFSDSVWAPA